jgi:hypothetical protein
MSSVLQTKPFRFARRVRLVCGVLAVLSISGFLASANTAILAMYNSWAIGVSSGCFEIGRDPYVRPWGPVTPAPTQGFEFVVQPGWNSGYAAAWRPFRAGSSKASRIMVPLWQPMLGFGIVAAFAHGMIVGGKRADRGTCVRCGYDLSRVPKGDARRCPECGEVDTRAAGRAAA